MKISLLPEPLIPIILPVTATVASSKNYPFSIFSFSYFYLNCGIVISLLNLCGYGFLPASLSLSRKAFLLSVYLDGSTSSSSTATFFSFLAGALASFAFLAANFSASLAVFFLAVCLFLSSLFETQSPVSVSRYSFLPSTSLS